MLTAGVDGDGHLRLRSRRTVFAKAAGAPGIVETQCVVQRSWVELIDGSKRQRFRSMTGEYRLAPHRRHPRIFQMVIAVLGLPALPEQRRPKHGNPDCDEQEFPRMDWS